LIFPTKYVILKRLKSSHWPSKVRNINKNDIGFPAFTLSLEIVAVAEDWPLEVSETEKGNGRKTQLPAYYT